MIAAFLSWFASLVTGRMPDGLRALGEWSLGYYGQTYGYLYLLTGVYPYSGPPAVDVPEAVEEEQPVETWPEPPEAPSFSAS